MRKKNAPGEEITSLIWMKNSKFNGKLEKNLLSDLVGPTR